jgi:hypothetical protein
MYHRQNPSKFPFGTFGRTLNQYFVKKIHGLLLQNGLTRRRRHHHHHHHHHHHTAPEVLTWGL